MRKTQRILTIVLWAILPLAMVGVVLAKILLPRGAGDPGPAHVHQEQPRFTNLEPLYPAAPFALTDQDGKPFASKDLAGRPYVAGFIFTQCAGVCPRMTATMAGLQKQLVQDVHLVSFSVDPERDTPAVLKSYAQGYKADESRWHFLTGPRDLALAVVRGMKLNFVEGSEAGPILHSEKLLLIDAAGEVRGAYDSNDAGQMKQIIPDAAKLVEEAKQAAAAGKASAKSTTVPATRPATGPAGEGTAS